MRRLSLALSLCASLLAGCQGAPPNRATTVTPGASTPSATAPALVELAIDLDRDAMPADTRTRVIARLRVDAAELAQKQRPPINLAVVIDTSGSMVGDAIAQARAAAGALLDGLQEGDRIAVITFDTHAAVLVAPTLVARDTLAPVRERIGAMEARGTTDLAGGLALALQQLTSAPLPGAVQRIVLLGDGVPNDAAPIPQYIAQASASGISISALGFGLEYDETVLGQLAQATGGRFHRIAQGESIETAFRDEVFRIERVVASGVVLTMQPGPGVSIERVLGHATAPDQNRAHAVRLADLAEHQRQDVYVELMVEGHRDGANIELIDATVAYQDRTANAGMLSQRTFIGGKATSSDDVPRDLEVERGAATARAAAATVDAIARSRAGDFAGADELLEVAEVAARTVAKAADDAALAKDADELAKLRKSLAAERKRYEKAMAEAERAVRKQQQDASKGGQPVRPMPMPAPHASMPAAELDGIKAKHSRAVETLQPQG